MTDPITRPLRVDDMRGDWALITGASSGIGRELAMQLAERGMNVVLVARRQLRLAVVAKDVQTRFGVRALVVAADLCESSAIATIKARLATERVAIRLLINNAGSGFYGHFEEGSAEVYGRMLQVNVVAPVQLTLALIDQLTTHSRSAVLNISSQAAFNPIPYMAVYASSKAFLHSFGQALWGELGERGVLVQTVVPGATDTEFDDIAGAPLNHDVRRDTPAQFAANTLAYLESEQPLTIAARGATLQRLFAALAPTKTMLRAVGKMFRPTAPRPSPACVPVKAREIQARRSHA